MAIPVVRASQLLTITFCSRATGVDDASSLKCMAFGNDFMVVDAVTQNVFFSPELIRRLAGSPPWRRVRSAIGRRTALRSGSGSTTGSLTPTAAKCRECATARSAVLPASSGWKGLTNKRDIRVSTANGRMVLSVTEDDLVRVNMGEPTSSRPGAVPAHNKAEKTYIMRAAEQRQYCAAWCPWKSALRHPG